MAGRHPRILVVDDDAEVRAAISDVLAEHAFVTTEAADAQRAVDQLASGEFDLVLLDLTLPDADGLSLLDRLREQRLPTIVVSGRASEADRVLGLEIGADDYVVKPFSGRELVARVRAVLRTADDGEPEDTIEHPGLRIDMPSRDVAVDGKAVALTAREFDLLVFLAASPRQVFSAAQLLEHVWGSSPEWQAAATVSEHVYRLRSKLSVARDRSGWIETLRGAGYRFNPEAFQTD